MHFSILYHEFELINILLQKLIDKIMYIAFITRYKIVMYQSNRSFNIPPGMPRTFDTFAFTGRIKFYDQSLPGSCLESGIFEPATLDFIWHFSVRCALHEASLSCRTRFGTISAENCGFVAHWLRSKKGLHKLFCIWRHLITLTSRM